MTHLICEGLRNDPEIPVAALSSTGCYQTAWSSWRFARCLLRGLRGEGIVRGVVANVDKGGNGGESKGDDEPIITMADLVKFTQSEMAFLADGRPEFCSVGWAPSTEAIVVASVSSGPHRGDGASGFDVGDRVLMDGQRAQIVSLEDTVAVLEMGGRDGGSIKRAEVASLKPFDNWRK